jgi:nicotinate-nucleotide adenylyltransferase
MDRSVSNTSVALFGGTFNPVHFGHLKIAEEMAELLQVSQMRLLPCGSPPHRAKPDVTAKQRLAMLNLALGDQSLLIADDQELNRAGPSYTIDTLKLVRQEIDDTVPLFLCLGMDVLSSLNTWHCWQQLLDYCHIAVSPRPGWPVPEHGDIGHWIARYRCDDINEVQNKANGCIYFCDLMMLELSSTTIRDTIKRGENISSMTPDEVVDYIKTNHLYE